MAEYTACSTGPTSYSDVVTALSKEIGRPIQIVQKDYFKSVEVFEDLVSGGSGSLPRYPRDALQRLILYYNFYGIKGNTNVLEWLIGRRPTTVEDFLRQKILDAQRS